MSRVPPALLALAALGIARLLPEHGVGLAIRLAAATAVVLLPGALVSRALRLRGLAPVLAWTLALLFGALALTFAFHRSLALTLWLFFGAGAVALPFALSRRPLRPLGGRSAAIALGAAIGIAVWWVAGFDGDAFFHLARVRKLDDFGGLSLHAVDEFRHGGLHPVYAFPLWHGVLAVIARVAGVDPSAVVLHEPTVLVPLAFGVVYEAGLALFASAWAAGAVVLAQAALTGLSPNGGGAYPTLALPATAARQLLVPAVLALFFLFVRSRSRTVLVTLFVGAGSLALVHPTYTLFLLVPLAGFLVARALLERRDLFASAEGLAAVGLPALGVLLWLRPIVNETISHNPSGTELRRALARYATQLDVSSEHRYKLAPEVFARGGSVAVAALVVLPLAALAARRRWSAFALGGSLAVFVLTLVPLVFPHFADAVSISQARRLAGFVPFAFVFAGGALVLARLLGFAAAAVGLGAGIALQLLYPGDFGFFLHHGGPALATWIAAIGGAVALLAAALARSRRPELEGRDALAALAAALFVLPVAVHGFSHWDRRNPDHPELTSGLIDALREQVPKRAVVFSDPETSYQAGAFAPVYIAAAPPTHVADTKANRPYERAREVEQFFRGRAGLEIPRRYGASYILVDRKRSGIRPTLPQSYSDSRYTLFRLGG